MAFCPVEEQQYDATRALRLLHCQAGLEAQVAALLVTSEATVASSRALLAQLANSTLTSDLRNQISGRPARAT
jgi:hypothetical protein